VIGPFVIFGVGLVLVTLLFGVGWAEWFGIENSVDNLPILWVLMIGLIVTITAEIW